MTMQTPHAFIQQAVICLRAPVAVLSLPDGQLRGGAEGYYTADTRLISRLVLTVDGCEPEPVDAQLLGTQQARFQAVHRCATDAGSDPTVAVERVRSADGDFESITIANHGRQKQSLRLSLALGCDLADISMVRSGRAIENCPPRPWGRMTAWSGAIPLRAPP